MTIHRNTTKQNYTNTIKLHTHALLVIIFTSRYLVDYQKFHLAISENGTKPVMPLKNSYFSTSIYLKYRAELFLISGWVLFVLPELFRQWTGRYNGENVGTGLWQVSIYPLYCLYLTVLMEDVHVPLDFI